MHHFVVATLILLLLQHITDVGLGEWTAGVVEVTTCIICVTLSSLINGLIYDFGVMLTYD